jgi:hypothetical protein
VPDAARIKQLQTLRLHLHRLDPPRPIRDVRAAVAFARDRRVVLASGQSALPSLAEAIVGRSITGSWMAHPEANQIQHILVGVEELPVLAHVSLALGRQTFLESRLAPAVERIAGDPDRRDTALARLPRPSLELLRAVEAEGEIRMDRWAKSARRGRAARVPLERHLLVVSRSVHAEQGSPAAVVVPWSRSQFSQGFRKAATSLTYVEAVDAVLLAAVRSAVIAREREARRWFTFGADRFKVLIADGKIERLATEKVSWLTCPQ